MIIKKRNTEEQKEKYIFEDETIPTIDSKNDNDNYSVNQILPFSNLQLILLKSVFLSF